MAQAYLTPQRDHVNKLRQGIDVKSLLYLIKFQANEAGSSSGMEFLAFQKAFTFLLGTTMIIKSFISDRHTSIAKWMREECPKKCSELGKPVVKHFFDIWHIGKSKLACNGPHSF